LKVWDPISWPAAYASLTHSTALGSSKRLLQFFALIKKVALILYFSKTSKAIGVVSGFGPSSTSIVVLFYYIFDIIIIILIHISI